MWHCDVGEGKLRRQSGYQSHVAGHQRWQTKKQTVAELYFVGWIPSYILMKIEEYLMDLTLLIVGVSYYGLNGFFSWMMKVSE